MEINIPAEDIHIDDQGRIVIDDPELVKVLTAQTVGEEGFGLNWKCPNRRC